MQQRNVSCPQLEVPACPTGFQLSCKTSECCPSCRCGKAWGQSWAGPGSSFKLLFSLLTPEFFALLATQGNGQDPNPPICS